MQFRPNLSQQYRAPATESVAGPLAAQTRVEADLRRIQGCRSKDIVKRLGHRDFDEAIHRDNLVVL